MRTEFQIGNLFYSNYHSVIACRWQTIRNLLQTDAPYEPIAYNMNTCSKYRQAAEHFQVAINSKWYKEDRSEVDW